MTDKDNTAPEESVDVEDQVETENSVDEAVPEEHSTESEKKDLDSDEAYCTSCGEPLKKEAEICPHCGVRQNDADQQSPGTPQKNPGLAAVASFFFAGLGQIYNGQIAKGLLLIVVQIINVALIFVLVGLVTYPIVWVYGMWDAYKTAEKINSGKVTV